MRCSEEEHQIVFNIRRQEKEETFHVTFNEDDEAISQISTEGHVVNFNEYFPYVPAFDRSVSNINILAELTIVSEPVTNLNSPASEEPPSFSMEEEVTVINEADHPELSEIHSSDKQLDEIK
ncbi:hypothetical protein Tco_0067760, partial [Tanacetum coccineum]